MKILVTGAAGFIGSHTSEALANDGHEVIGIDNFSDYYDPAIKKQTSEILKAKGIKIMSGDLAEKNWENNFSLDFDYIFHFAAQPGISSLIPFEQYQRNNFTATENLLRFALKNDGLKMFVNISTSSVYGIVATNDEQTPPSPASYYGVTKLAAEQMALSYSRMNKLKVCSLRLFSVYGPRERPDKLYTRLIDSIINNKSLSFFKGSEKHVRSFTYVGDIVKGILSVISQEDACNNQVINLGSEKEYSTSYGIEVTERLLNKKASLQILPSRPGDQLYTKANILKAKQLLNYEPLTTLEEGLKQQIEWFLNKEKRLEK